MLVHESNLRYISRIVLFKYPLFNYDYTLSTGTPSNAINELTAAINNELELAVTVS